jgi:hypothetical protein
MKFLAVSMAALLTSVVSAQAESFTVSGSSQVTNHVGGMVAGGHEVEATFSTGQDKVVYASGKKTSGKFSCAQWSATAGSMFQSDGMCTVDEGADQFTVSYVCQVLDSKSNGADCWGRLTGTGGTLANKAGSAVWHGVDSADHKSGTFSGTGMWN